MGLATATKLIPGLFIITLAARGERRAAIIATLTFAAATGLASVLRPAASVDFFLRLMWDPGRTGNVAYFSNQSVFGMISRTALRPYAGWIDGFAGCALVPLLVTSCARSQHCHSRSTENVVAAVATGVTATLVSPIAWVHEVVWLVPAALLLAGLARSSWARTAVVSILAVTLIAGLPYMSASVKGIAGDALADSYGVLGILVVVILCGWLSGWPVRCWLAIYRPSLKKGREAIQKGEEIMRKRLRAALRSVPRLAVLATAGVLALGTPAMAAYISSTAVSARSAAPNTASTCPRGGTYGVCTTVEGSGLYIDSQDGQVTFNSGATQLCGNLENYGPSYTSESPYACYSVGQTAFWNTTVNATVTAGYYCTEWLGGGTTDDGLSCVDVHS